jgi:hypothetical protein
MSSVGISATAAGGKLFVSDTTVRDNVSRGILATGTVNVVIDRARFENNGATGIQAIDGPALSVRESVVAGNFFGVSITATTGNTTRLTVDSSLLADNSASGANAFATDAGSLATLDMIRSTSTRNTTGNGAVSMANAPAIAVMTVAASILSENSGYGVFATNNSTALASGNTIARNASGGLASFGGGVLHTRSNSAGEQSFPTSGTTPIGGF